MSNFSGKNREKTLAIVTAVVIAGVLLFSTIIQPQLTKHKQLTEYRQKLQLKLAKIQGDMLVKDRIDNIYKQIEPLIVSTGTDQQQISLFTRELSNLYSKLNLKIRSVKILPNANEDFYKRLLIQIEMSGQIKDVLNFVLSVEVYRNPIKIERLDIKAQETPDHVQLTLVISKVISKAET